MPDVSRPTIMEDMVRADARDRGGLRGVSGDEYRDLFETTYPRLVRTLWFVVHDHELAQEIAQEAFAELYRQWSKVGSYDRPELWVRRVALRKAQREAARTVRRLRAERDSVADLEVSAPDLPDPALRAAIRALPPRQRAVVALYYLEDRPNGRGGRPARLQHRDRLRAPAPGPAPVGRAACGGGGRRCPLTTGSGPASA
jgi:RNA polymerase sigma-70 factor (ECF subfamily)